MGRKYFAIAEVFVSDIGMLAHIAHIFPSPTLKLRDNHSTRKRKRK
jgi:hypothetical protein